VVAVQGEQIKMAAQAALAVAEHFNQAQAERLHRVRVTTAAQDLQALAQVAAVAEKLALARLHLAQMLQVVMAAQVLQVTHRGWMQ
jgi:hypothetical protein